MDVSLYMQYWRCGAWIRFPCTDPLLPKLIYGLLMSVLRTTRKNPFMAVQTMATALGMGSRTTIHACLDELESYGLIERVHRAGSDGMRTSNEYSLDTWCGLKELAVAADAGRVPAQPFSSARLR